MNTKRSIQAGEMTDRRILDSLAPGGQHHEEIQDDLDWIDHRVYPRLQYRERYYQPGEEPFA